jgi:hypothetical protein
MTRAADTVHEGEAHAAGEPLPIADIDSPALENLARSAHADEPASYAREPMDSQSTAAFKAWALSAACRDAQGWR